MAIGAGVLALMAGTLMLGSGASGRVANAADAGLTADEAHALAEQARLGQGVDVDRVKAARLHQVAADLGDARSHHALAQHFRGAWGDRNDPVAARRHLEAAAGLGLAAAQAELAFAALNGAPADLAQAYRWFAAAADQGHAGAVCMIGDFHRDGLGGAPQDPARAVQWYRQAAAQADPCASRAQLALHHSYAQGQGVERDDAMALDWLRRAAQAGNPSAQATLGRVYQQGTLVAVDATAAQQWLAKSREGVAPHDEHGHPNGFGLDFRMRRP